jgi:glycosyltransferase involved in cell wall biosynthesis
MKAELIAGFQQPGTKITVIPFGLNNVLPVTTLTGAEARARLGLAAAHKVILFFGNIAPYKGLEFLIAAFERVAAADPACRLVIAGRPKGDPDYWVRIQASIRHSPVRDRILQVIEYVSDAQTEWYFKAADVSVLPYVHVFQSGVLSLSYSFGLPVLAADVGSLREDILVGQTGLVFPPGNPGELARRLQEYFASDLYQNLGRFRAAIREYAAEKYSWTKVAARTTAVYARLSGGDQP